MPCPYHYTLYRSRKIYGVVTKLKEVNAGAATGMGATATSILLDPAVSLVVVAASRTTCH